MISSVLGLEYAKSSSTSLRREVALFLPLIPSYLCPEWISGSVHG